MLRSHSCSLQNRDMNTNATQAEAILEPDLPIIDPHHHLWDWPAALLANIPTPHHGFSTVILRAMHYLLPELLNDTNSGHNIRATVFMECGSMYRADAAAAFKSIGETAGMATSAPVPGSSVMWI
jgi:L-fuconolactonase